MNKARIQDLKELIAHESEGPVLSVFCRTDPRDPANSSETPAWSIALKNGLSAICASQNGDHDQSQAVKKLCSEAERRIAKVSASERGRSVALFLGGGGKLDSFTTFQIPVRNDYVTVDSGPVVWPMLDVIDRGQRTGLVLLSQDRIRLLEWSDGTTRDLEESTFDLELGDWHQYRGPARPQGTVGGGGVSNVSAYGDRVEAWRSRFLKEAAKAIAESANDLGFDRLVAAAEGELGAGFNEALPAEMRSRLATTVHLNLIDLSAAEAGAALDPHLRQAWRDSVAGTGATALARSQAGDRAVSGPDEVLLALGEGRVEHLICDPYLATEEDGLSEGSRQAIRDAGEASVQEAMVELALRTDARVSSASVEEVPALGEADGALALLRY
ncbi:MAG: hypothetical protein J0H98_03620 [Solirubrobacterales bacterium]|nr:hypothetical protein [Solirubrobacterales bacterium]